MKEIDDVSLKQIQLDILIRFHEFCVNHGIKYSLSSGTLIGAIRHKGYIPWDDDIDVYMLRDEYNRFEREFSDEYLRVLSSNTKRDCIYPFAKVFDSRTLLIEGVKYNTKNLGVNIDIFQIDSVPDDMKSRRRLFRKNSIIDKMIKYKQMEYWKSRGILRNAVMYLIRFLLLPFSIYWLVRKKSSLAGPFNPEAKDICNVMAGNGISTCIPMSVMKSYIDVEFEGRMFKCMKDYDLYLRKNYGDYLQLPPLEKQVTHHAFKAYWK